MNYIIPVTRSARDPFDQQQELRHLAGPNFSSFSCSFLLSLSDQPIKFEKKIEARYIYVRQLSEYIFSMLKSVTNTSDVSDNPYAINMQ